MPNFRCCFYLTTFACIVVPLLFDSTAFSLAVQDDNQKDVTESNASKAEELEARLITSARQFTRFGSRAGEGYPSADGKWIIFQSERPMEDVEQPNPFYQIFMQNLETGDIERISPGYGKTTCSWVHPTNSKKVLFASTHDDPDSVAKQIEYIKKREEGTLPRYEWDYDSHFEIFEFDREKKTYKNLTNVKGYDAEGSYSPDGQLIAFASNRKAYDGSMTDEDAKKFKIDPAHMTDIYIMNVDGSNVKQLTSVPGYDGGPFFSPDGKRICWRRFSEDGARAEIMTMNIDGSDQKQLTKMNYMSWAPMYHPSGEYLIFNTNKHGFNNFELYLVDTEGNPPIRASFSPGFDGLAAFSSDGNQLYWCSTRHQPTLRKGQLFRGKWNHEAALKALGLSGDAVAAPAESTSEDDSAQKEGVKSSQSTDVEFAADDILRHVLFLCRPELGGRMTGTEGERKATQYVAGYLSSLGITPGGDNGGWFQKFEFPAGASLGNENRLVAKIGDSEKTLELNKDWRPLSFSGSGEYVDAAIAFGGYGLQAKAADGQAAYDSFVHLDVKDKWVLVFRYLPEEITAEKRKQLAIGSTLRSKARLVRDMGAKGLIVVSGPKSNVREQLVPLQRDSALAGTSLPVISITDEVAEEWLKAAGKDPSELQTQLDSGEMMMGFEITGVKLGAMIDVTQEKAEGQNVVGRLLAGPKPSDEAIIICAHIDHLGKGITGSSLAKGDEKGQIHFGADDNASGVAAMLDIAEFLADKKKSGELNMKRDIIFAAWSGEELNLQGSKHFVEQLKAIAGSDGSVYPKIAACLNMDMVGRFDKALVIQGLGSSEYWGRELDKMQVVFDLPITAKQDTNLPTDATSFYLAGVPILSAFTGSHKDYHTPRDTPEKLDYDRAAEIAKFMGEMARRLVVANNAPVYKQHQAEPKKQVRGGMRALLGTIPDYAAEVKGVKLSGVGSGQPAEKAGIKGGDVIVRLAGKKIENIYDYTDVLAIIKPGKAIKIVVLRGDKEIELDITPMSRD